MVHELVERFGIIGPKLQGVLIGRDRAREITEFSPGVSQIVNCLREIRLKSQGLLKRLPRFGVQCSNLFSDLEQIECSL